jgi:cobalamin biosynthesis protein CobT
MRATIITLEPEVQIEGVSFEEAFGESSELKGRGRERRRKRRQERRMKRIRDRQERKRAKQEMRAEQQEARQVRKDKRKSRRVARKEMGADESEEEETKPTSTEETQPSSTEEATTDSSSQENEPQGENVGNDSYGDADTEELGDNQDVNDEESSFDAETAGTESSFDDENYDSETSEETSGFRGGLKRRNPKNGQISILRRRIRNYEIKLNRVSEMLKAGKLPSNKVAFYAKRLKAGSHTLSQMKNKLANMEKMQSQASSIPVKADLQPQLSQNKIVVPAKGADGEDTSMFDNDETSSFDGKAFVSKNKGILIGLGIGIVAILVLNKMKVFK